MLIVAINVVGGIIIGVAQKGMSFADATHTFTLLTVGDGLYVGGGSSFAAQLTGQHHGARERKRVEEVASLNITHSGGAC